MKLIMKLMVLCLTLFCMINIHAKDFKIDNFFTDNAWQINLKASYDNFSGDEQAKANFKRLLKENLKGFKILLNLTAQEFIYNFVQAKDSPTFGKKGTVSVEKYKIKLQESDNNKIVIDLYDISPKGVAESTVVEKCTLEKISYNSIKFERKHISGVTMTLIMNRIEKSKITTNKSKK